MFFDLNSHYPFLLKIYLFLASILSKVQHARGEANSDSDIDLLAVLKSPVSQVQEISYMSALCVKILLDYDELVSIVPMSEDRFNAKDVSLLRNIQREGIEL